MPTGREEEWRCTPLRRPPRAAGLYGAARVQAHRANRSRTPGRCFPCRTGASPGLARASLRFLMAAPAGGCPPWPLPSPARQRGPAHAPSASEWPPLKALIVSSGFTLGTRPEGHIWSVRSFLLGWSRLLAWRPRSAGQVTAAANSSRRQAYVDDPSAEPARPQEVRQGSGHSVRLNPRVRASSPDGPGWAGEALGACGPWTVALSPGRLAAGFRPRLRVGGGVRAGHHGCLPVWYGHGAGCGGHGSGRDARLFAGADEFCRPGG